MRTLWVLLALAPLASLACKESPPAAEAPAVEAPHAQDPYQADIDALCNAEARSGAIEQPESARPITVAAWLGTAIQTDEARKFLVELTAPEQTPEGKVALLKAETTKLGIPSCPLIASWSGAGESRLP